ncbi:MAG: hypothetical protein ACKVP2_13550 [Burkholderiales bacterium]
MKSGLTLALHIDPENYPVNLASKYPRILDRIALLWGTPNLEKYLQELIVDSRGNRAGFPPEVMLELGRVQDLTMKYRIQNSGPEKRDPWETAKVY